MRQLKIAAFVALSLGALSVLTLAFATGAGARQPFAPTLSEDGIWETTDGGSSAQASAITIEEVPRALRLNSDALARQLAEAPQEAANGGLRNSPAVVSLPMPDGSFMRFRIEESPVMDAAAVARYPEIKSYRGQGIDDGTMTARFDWTPLGFHAFVLTADRAMNIRPLESDPALYTSTYYAAMPSECSATQVSQTALDGPITSTAPAASTTAVAPTAATGSTLRTYRIAFAVTNKSTDLFGHTVAGTVAALNAMLNGINAIYEREVAIHLNLVDAPNIIYADDNNVCGAGNAEPCTDANDPYTDGDDLTMLQQVRPDLRDKVGVANYDVGHVLGQDSGLADVGVCNNAVNRTGPAKGGGVSGLHPPAGNVTEVNLTSHELGHQFGASHTYNAGGGCLGPRWAPTAYETGSGTTLMSYAGGCAPDRIVGIAEGRFHAASISQIGNYIANDRIGSSCGSQTSTGNTPPTVSAGIPYTIPKLTPFKLTATGSDADPGDAANLTYVWEEMDSGGTLYPNPPYGDQPDDPVTTTRPLFRPFPAAKDATRTFPSLTYILNNANIPPATINGFQTAENLPAVSRTMNFRATIRDNRTGGGGVADSSVAITVDGNSGPFAVTAPNGGGTLGGSQTVTWDVNNTNAAPISCATVRILLSIDGGETFPFVLAASVPNNGSAEVTMPNGIISTIARVKIEAVENIFFDVSDANFSITPGDTCPAASAITPEAGVVGDTVTITGVNFSTGGNVDAVAFTNNVAASFTVGSDTTITAIVPRGAAGGPITLSKASCPDIKTSGYAVCPGNATTLAIDDGGRETRSDAQPGDYFVNRLTPVAYPATLTKISIYWDAAQGFPPGTAINVLAGTNVGGGTNLDRTSFQTFAATAGPQPGFTSFAVPKPITITSGDFVVGFRVPSAPAGSLPLAIDNSQLAGRSYKSRDGITFAMEANRNYMIRAEQVFANCSLPPSTAASPIPSQPLNISTRLRVETGDNVMIGGFIITGNDAKKVIIRALGPSLQNSGINNALADPVLELRGSDGRLILKNDNWRDAQEAEIKGSTVPPPNELEAAMVATLAPGAYTAVVTGKDGSVGVGLIEVYDLDQAAASQLANISTRGLVQTDTGVLIGGFILGGGNEGTRVVVRAIGPSLAGAGVVNPLANPTLDLRDANGARLVFNDNWRDDPQQAAELSGLGIQPQNELEAAIVARIPPGSYTAITAGANGGTGVGLVEVYNVK